MKTILPYLVLILVLPTVAYAQAVPDSGMIRFRTDLDSVRVTLDGGEPLQVDSYGNALGGTAWYILRVVAADHVITFVHSGYEPIVRTVAVPRNEAVTIDLRFVEPPAVSPDTTPQGTARVIISSEPDSAYVWTAKQEDSITTPVELLLPSGRQSITVTRDGYELLSQEIELAPDQQITLRFLLRPDRPAAPQAEELGLERHPTFPMMDSIPALRIKKRFGDLAETFAIIPLGQGVMARLVAGREGAGEANVLIVAGIGLTLGSYFLGSLLSSRKRREITRENEANAQYNRQAAAHNKDVDRIIRDTRAEMIRQWRKETARLGRVVVDTARVYGPPHPPAE